MTKRMNNYMYDMSSQFNSFYKMAVVLPADKQNELREKRKLNIQRLKDGLKEYNDEHGTNYKICENRIQGSLAMSTVVQNDSNDYDIDVAIVFEDENLGELGAQAIRKIVADALKRKTKQFNTEPDVKTSCVRIKYSDGYHVDFAVYKRHKENDDSLEYTYEHAGADWSKRNVKAIEEWFTNEIDDKGKNLRKVIRLSKMFCKSKESWINMPSGLIQTVLCDEQYASDYSRIDECFYYTMKSIVDRLENDVYVNAPVDNGRALVTRKIDEKRNENWKNRLSEKLDELNVLFDDNCTYEQALNAWSSFFNNTYWNQLLSQLKENRRAYGKYQYRDTEQFIEDMYAINDQYDVNIDCKVSANGFSPMSIKEFISTYFTNYGGFIPHGFSVKCKIRETNAPHYDKVLWKVRNVGDEAERQDDIRGQIQDRGREICENTKFYGHHYIECYLIEKNICIAIGHTDVPIARN